MNIQIVRKITQNLLVQPIQKTKTKKKKLYKNKNYKIINGDIIKYFMMNRTKNK